MDVQDSFSEFQHRRIGWVEVVDRECPQCGRDNAHQPAGRYSLGVWAVKACADCGFTYIDQAPASTSLSEDIPWEKSAQVEAEWRNASRGIQQSLSRWTRWRLHLLPRKTMPHLLRRHARPGNVLDLGCGDGGQMLALGDGFVPHGIEISRRLSSLADARFRARGGGAVCAPCADGLAQFPDGHFAAATLRSYLEHEPEPARILRELHRTLRPGGIAIVKVPNFASLNRRVLGARWCGFRHPDHLNYFTPGSLRSMARKAGFQVRFGATWRLPTSDNMYALLVRGRNSG